MLRTILVGLLLGSVQGYWLHPMGQRAPWITDMLLPARLPLPCWLRAAAILLIFVVLHGMYFGIVGLIQVFPVDPGTFGRGWVLGFFIGLCMYMIVLSRRLARPQRGQKRPRRTTRKR